MQKRKSKLLLRIINKTYNAISTPAAIITVAAIIILWFVLGIPMHYNDFWYKALHLFELLVTLILVFIIEVAQKAEMRSIQEKLDELIEKNPKTDDRKAGIEKKYKGGK